MIYPLVGAVSGLGVFLYTNQAPPAAAPAVTPQEPVSADTFTPSPISDYLELQTAKDKFTLYSHLHKQPLATHHLITKQHLKQLEKQQSPKAEEVQIPQKDLQVKKTDSILSDSEISSSSEALSETEDAIVLNRNQGIYQRCFRSYAHELLSSGKCQSVQLIQGPIFSKDTPYKVKNSEGKSEKMDQIFTSTININQNGQYLTDRFYSIVICNTADRHYVNGFTMRRSYASPVFNLTRYLTSLLKIEQQTGLTFNVSGDYLTLIDYDNINKERKYADYEN